MRAYSAIGILLMHVLANGDYALHGFLFEQLIPAFTNLVFLFASIIIYAIQRGDAFGLLNNRVVHFLSGILVWKPT